MAREKIDEIKDKVYENKNRMKQAMENSYDKMRDLKDSEEFRKYVDKY